MSPEGALGQRALQDDSDVFVESGALRLGQVVALSQAGEGVCVSADDEGERERL